MGGVPVVDDGVGEFAAFGGAAFAYGVVPNLSR
jgi:hypothetical protein